MIAFECFQAVCTPQRRSLCFSFKNNNVHNYIIQKNTIYIFENTNVYCLIQFICSVLREGFPSQLVLGEKYKIALRNNSITCNKVDIKMFKYQSRRLCLYLLQLCRPLPTGDTNRPDIRAAVTHRNDTQHCTEVQDTGRSVDHCIV